MFPYLYFPFVYMLFFILLLISERKRKNCQCERCPLVRIKLETQARALTRKSIWWPLSAWDILLPTEPHQPEPLSVFSIQLQASHIFMLHNPQTSTLLSYHTPCPLAVFKYSQNLITSHQVYSFHSGPNHLQQTLNLSPPDVILSHQFPPFSF